MAEADRRVILRFVFATELKSCSGVVQELTESEVKSLFRRADEFLLFPSTGLQRASFRLGACIPIRVGLPVHPPGFIRSWLVCEMWLSRASRGSVTG